MGLIMNSFSIGGFKNPFSKDVQLDDGIFEILLIRMPHNLSELQTIIIDLVNHNIHSEMIVYLQSSKIVFKSDPIGWTLDGEFGGIKEYVEFQNCQKMLQIVGT